MYVYTYIYCIYVYNVVFYKKVRGMFDRVRFGEVEGGASGTSHMMV